MSCHKILKGSGKSTVHLFFEIVLEEQVTIFVIKQLVHLARGCTELHIDGTFKVVPKKPSARQLVTLMTIFRDHVGALLYYYYILVLKAERLIY